MSEVNQMPEFDEVKDDSPSESELEPAPLKPAEPVKERKAETARKNWRELATFFVSFGYIKDKGGEEGLYTRVQSKEGSKVKQWEGVVTDSLMEWMLSQADLPLPPEPEPQAEMPPPAELSQPLLEPKTVLELAELLVSEVRAPVVVGKQPDGELLRAESRLNLSGPAAAGLSDNRLSFHVELYLVNLETQQSEQVASQLGQLIPGTLSYALQQDFPIPTPGRYQLYGVARLLPPGEAAAHMQGPIIRVEA